MVHAGQLSAKSEQEVCQNRELKNKLNCMDGRIDGRTDVAYDNNRYFFRRKKKLLLIR